MIYEYDTAGNLREIKRPWSTGYNVTKYELDPAGTGLVESVTTPTDNLGLRL